MQVDPPFPIRERKAIRALASAPRQEIVDRLAALGPSTVAKLAASLGRTPSSLYYHLDILSGVGLVVQAKADATAGRTEALLQTPARRMEVDLELASEDDLEALTDLHPPILRAAMRDMELALRARFEASACDRPADRAADRAADGPTATAGRTKGWLSASDFDAVREHLAAIEALLTRSRPGEPGCEGNGTNGQLHAFTFALAPVEAAGTTPSSDHATANETDES